MKKYGLAVSCLICGLLLGLGVQTFAADSIRHVTASINETFRFVVDGEETELPEEYDVLVYNNRTYLPVRAVGDMLGAQIDWNGENAGQGREQWFYTDVYEIYGTDTTEAVAVKVNNSYHIAKRQ